MDTQTIIVAGIILVAALYVGQILRRKLKSLSSSSSCEVDCGCSKSKNKITQRLR